MSRRAIGQATLVLAASSLGVNLLQLVRLVLVSSWFGATARLDDYFRNLGVPLACLGIILGAAQTSVVPAYVRLKEHGDDETADRLLTTAIAACTALIAALAAALFAAAPAVLFSAGAGRAGVADAGNVAMFRFLLLTLVAGGVADLLATGFNANRRYIATALAPLAAMGATLGYLVAFRHRGVACLPEGQVLGVVVQFSFLAAACVATPAFRFRRPLPLASPHVLGAAAVMGPMILVQTLAHANPVIDNAFATALGDPGLVTILTYAGRMHDVVVKLTVMSVAGALLPFLSLYVAQGRMDLVRSTLRSGLRLAVLVLVPLAAGIALFGPRAVAVVFQRGEFGPRETALVSACWAAYSAGCVTMAASVFSQRCLLAMGLTGAQMAGAALAIPLNVLLDWWLSRWLGVAGIALATPLVYGFLAAWQYHAVGRADRAAAVAGVVAGVENHGESPAPEPSQAGWAPILLAVGAFGAIALIVRAGLDAVAPLVVVSPAGRSFTLAGLVAGSTACTVGYALILRRLDIPEAHAAYQLLPSPLRRASEISAPPR